jgi:acetyl esterase/lipase
MTHPGMAMVRELTAGALNVELSLLEERAAIEVGAGAMPVPDGVTVEPATVGGQPAEWITPDGGDRSRVLLYLHGGGYCIGSINTHRSVACRLALATGTAVCNLDYRLAPEHPFPAAIDDAVAAYREVLDGGTAPGSIAIGGDSAGGGLTLATLLALRAAGTPLPGAAVCLSPWTDLTQSAGTYSSRSADDPMVTKVGLDRMADAYLAGTPATEPLASPRYADLAGLPPLMVEVGDAEILLDDSLALVERARAAGVEVTLRVWPELCHVFQLFPPEIIPESDESIAAIGAFLGSHLT